MAIAVDLTPLRDARYRRLWAGASIAGLASKLTVVLVAKQVYDLTGSSLAVGAIAAAELVPLIVVALVGGAISDAFDRRRVLVVCGLGELVCVVGLAVNAFAARPQLWLVYVCAAAMAGLSSVSIPTRWAVTPRLVPPEQIPAAAALESVSWNLAEISGPGIAGVLLWSVGTGGGFVAQAIAVVAALATLARLGALPPAPGASGLSLGAIVDGVRFLRGRRVVLGTYLIDFNAMLFGMPSALFPAIAAERFDGSELALGLLFAAPGVGALVGSLTSGWSVRVHRHGLAVVLAVVVWGVAVTGFGIGGPLWLAVLFLAVAGWADLVSVVFRKTIWAALIHDSYRGRLGGIAWANVRGGLLAGNIEAGTVARFTSTTFSVVSGGIACIVGAAVLAVALPRFVRYDARTDREAELGPDPALI